MVITEQKSIDIIIRKLENKKNIFIIGCGECADVAHTGGEKQVKEIKEHLKQIGKNVVGSKVPDAPCFELQVNRLIRENKEEIFSADAVLIMSCGLGVQNFKNKLKNKSVIPGCNTLFIGNVNKRGNKFSQYCLACGDCILDETEGYCSITRCPKNMLNGPCGGVHDGKCEVDRKKDCVWILIYQSLSKNNNVKKLKETKIPKSHNINVKPMTRSLEDE